MKDKQHLNLKDGGSEIKTKAAEAILDRLNDFLPRLTVIELTLAFAIRPSITICCVVNQIIKEYNSTEANEQKVNDLLERLLRIHFFPRVGGF